MPFLFANVQAAEVLKLNLKIFWSCTQFQLPACLDSDTRESDGAISAAHTISVENETCAPDLLPYTSLLSSFLSLTNLPSPSLHGAVMAWLNLTCILLHKHLPEGHEGKEPAGQPTEPEERKRYAVAPPPSTKPRMTFPLLLSGIARRPDTIPGCVCQVAVVEGEEVVVRHRHALRPAVRAAALRHRPDARLRQALLPQGNETKTD